MNRALLIILSTLGVIASPCNLAPALAQTELPDEVLRWNKITVDAVRRDNTPPPLASRNLAIVHGAIYDASNAVSQTHAAYRVSLKAAPHASPRAAVAAAAHRALIELYPAQKRTLDEALRGTIDSIRDGLAADAGRQVGIFIAERLLDWRRSDTAIAIATQESFRDANAGLWLPTPPQFKKALLPQWGRVASFAVRNKKDFRSEPPPSLSSSEYAQCFEETKALGAIDSKVRTDDQTEIAHFWADGPNTWTPPGHWNEIARTVARKKGNTLAENARLFALLNISMADAAICCWDCKFTFKFWRPVTAIRNANDDNNPATTPDPDWTPLLETPPFPAYTSGHSSFSGAAAAVLADFFGRDDIRFVATSDTRPRLERSYSSFSEAAEEAGMSRIYGGIHWACDNTEGLAMGRSIGSYVCDRLLLDVPTARRANRANQPSDLLVNGVIGRR